MRAVNHTVTGAIIAGSIANPAVGLSAAFLSHFVLDMLPHYGGEDTKSKQFLYGLALDAGLAASFLLAILLLQPDNWLVMIAGGILAASPDLLWFPYWVLELRGKPRQPGRVSHFLGWIQWCERPWGIYVEIAWLIAALFVFMRVMSS